MLQRNTIYKKRSANIKVNAQMPILTQISRTWKKTGQQHNRVRILLCQAFESTYNNTEIALEIRRFAFRCAFFSEGKRNKVRNLCLYWYVVINDIHLKSNHILIILQDKRYRSIIARVQKTRKD